MTSHDMQHLAQFFARSRPRLDKLAGRLCDDPDVAVDDAERRFMAMVPDLAYADKPDHPLASALFTTTVNLAIYLALKQRNVDLHVFGCSLLEGLARAPAAAFPPEPADDAQRQAQADAFAASAADSQRDALPGEDVYEMVPGDGTTFDWGMNVKSCAVCHQFAKYDAMELVPYMCAADDVMSDRTGRGLQRTGSIALGATHCDFRYKRGGEPRRLAEQYPDRIRTARD
jgi:DNA-directed RNA polymerase specialized sigma24 family protein